MKQIKITILGRGNAGCLTALHYGYYARDLKNISIELLYDSNISPEKVGQATLLGVPNLLWKALGINWYENPIDATPKFGILYENWGKKNDKIFHPFPLYLMAMHYNPAKLQETILKSGYFSVQEKHIYEYEQIDSDYIFDCRGKPADNWDDYTILTNPLNAVLLGEGKSKECDINWTRAVATPDGWTFVIPNTTQTTSYGYLYNDGITSTKKAAANFKKLFNLAKQGIYLNEKVDNFKFKNYVAKNPIIDDRIILNGNKLFFLEPLESTAIEMYDEWNRYVFDWIFHGHDSVVTVERFRRKIHQIKNFILWHYLSGSKYDTPFWNYAKTLKLDDPKINDLIKSMSDDKYVSLRNEEDTEYGLWPRFSFKNWYDGVT